MERSRIIGTFDGVLYSVGRLYGGSVDIWTEDGRLIIVYDNDPDPLVFEGGGLGCAAEITGERAELLLGMAAQARRQEPGS